MGDPEQVESEAVMSPPDLLDHFADRPARTLVHGETLVSDGELHDTMFVLVTGVLEVAKDGNVISTIDRPGSIVGEVGALLGTGATATVTARSDTVVHVVDDAGAVLRSDPVVTFEVARLLAERLDLVTRFLADLRAQYGDASGSLAVVDNVLSSLARRTGPAARPGSARDADPLY